MFDRSEALVEKFKISAKNIDLFKYILAIFR